MNKTKIVFLVLSLVLLTASTASARNEASGSSVSGMTLQLEPPQIIMDKEAPANVADLHVSDRTTTSITYAWTNPTNPDFAGVIITVNNEEPVELTNDETSYIAIGLTPNTEYTIVVKAFDNAPSTESINLCSKVAKVGAWGMCTDAVTKGTFEYIPESVDGQIVFKADATGLIGADTEYALIYYADSDENNVEASTIPVQMLARSNSLSNEVHFLGSHPVNDNIPSSEDVNPRGKIWMVPLNNVPKNIDDDRFPTWANMNQYLFEEDSGNEVSVPFNDETGSIGGITFTYSGP